LMASVRRKVLALDRNLTLQRLGTLEESLGAGLARRRFSTLLLTLFAGLAMVLLNNPKVRPTAKVVKTICLQIPSRH
jgi:hypothetical protein